LEDLDWIIVRTHTLRFRIVSRLIATHRILLLGRVVHVHKFVVKTSFRCLSLDYADNVQEGVELEVGDNPNIVPPPLRAQNRSEYDIRLTVIGSPDAVTSV
jgi:hypothetical protein